MKALIILVLILLACALARAETPEVMGLHMGSWHEDKAMNNFNPGVYARWKNGFTAGAYYNSEKRPTAYAGWTFHDKIDRFAITLGAATGYKRAAIVPLVVPSVRFGVNENTSVRLSAVPLKGQAAVHLSLEKRF